MVNYYELNFTLVDAEEHHRDLLIHSLSEAGFDTFEETQLGFKAYIPSADFDEKAVQQFLESFRGMFSFSYELMLIPGRNWNEEWEKNFEPLDINHQVYIRASFHPRKTGYPYEIIIDPKMAFGTGHHQTTTLMMEYLLDEDLKGKRVLDMGAGTGILAILAGKMGASELMAIDYDPVCADSCMENATLNKIKMDIRCGSVEAIPDQEFDLILANINRNILLEQLARYVEVLAPNGLLFLSGFYTDADLPILREKAESLGLTFTGNRSLKGWCAARFSK